MKQEIGGSRRRHHQQNREQGHPEDFRPAGAGKDPVAAKGGTAGRGFCFAATGGALKSATEGAGRGAREQGQGPSPERVRPGQPGGVTTSTATGTTSATTGAAAT